MMANGNKEKWNIGLRALLGKITVDYMLGIRRIVVPHGTEMVCAVLKNRTNAGQVGQLYLEIKPPVTMGEGEK